MKKKIFTVLLVCMMMALSACSNKKTEGNSSGETSNAKTEETIKTEETDKTKDEKAVVAIGEVAPDIEFTLMDGSTAKLSDYKGKPVLINFWATWCGYCVDEMPAFEMLKEKYGDELTILALNCGGDTEDDIKAFAEDNGYTFDFAIVSNEEALKYDVQSIPTTVIIDDEGIISYMISVGYDADTMFNEYYNPEVEKVVNKQ